MNPPQIVAGRVILPPTPGQYEMGIPPVRTPLPRVEMPMVLRAFSASEVDPTTWNALVVPKFKGTSHDGNTETDVSAPLGRPRMIMQWVPDAQPAPARKYPGYTPPPQGVGDLAVLQLQGPNHAQILDQQSLINYLRGLLT